LLIKGFEKNGRKTYKIVEKIKSVFYFINKNTDYLKSDLLNISKKGKEDDL